MLISYISMISECYNLEKITIMFKWVEHFLNNFRALEIKANAMKHVVKIPIRVKKDAKLLIKFIRIAGEGIRMNLLTFRKPNVIIIRDDNDLQTWTWSIQHLR